MIKLKLCSIKSIFYITIVVYNIITMTFAPKAIWFGVIRLYLFYKKYSFIHHVAHITMIITNFIFGTVSIGREQSICPNYLIIHSIIYIYLITYIVMIIVNFTFDTILISLGQTIYLRYFII